MSDPVSERAVILAAGLGTRLRPLTWATPKALLPLWGTPLLEHWLRRLESWGVREIAVNTHWLPEQVADFCQRRQGVARIVIAHEPEILGTGGALRNLRSFLGTAPFWLLNADVVASVAPGPLRAPFARGTPLACVWLDARRGPRTVRCDPDTGTVLSYRGGLGSGSTFCGVHRVHPRVLAYLPPDDPCSIIEAYEQARMAGETVFGIELPSSFWADAGTPATYLAVHDEVRRRWCEGAAGGEHFDPAWCRTPPQAADFVCGPPESPPCPEGSTASCVILGAGSRIATAGPLESVVAGAHCHLAWPLRDATVVSAAALPDPAIQEGLKLLGWRAAESTAQPLAARGSDRHLVRLGHRDGRRAMGVVFGPQRPENARYGGHARVLRAAGVRVPHVLAERAEQGLLLLEDVGDASLQELMGGAGEEQGAGERAFDLYTRALALLGRMHVAGAERVRREAVALEPPFDATLYRWEHALFADHLVGNMPGAPLQRREQLMAELQAISRQLQQAPPVLLHRDFQSSNVLLPEGEPCLIDFQGMRWGPAAYDVASILYDAYVDVPPAWHLPLLASYAEAACCSVDAVQAFLLPASIQRLVQALGAFGRLGAQPSTRRFRRYIAPAAARLMRLAHDDGRLPLLAELAAEALALPIGCLTPE